MTGESLLKAVAIGTGLPQEQVLSELRSLIDKNGLNHETITIEDLRLILAEYLQSVLIQSKNNCA